MLGMGGLVTDEHAVAVSAEFGIHSLADGIPNGALLPRTVADEVLEVLLGEPWMASAMRSMFLSGRWLKSALR
jgi:hypothetical protein